MSKTLQYLMNEVDSIIEKKATEEPVLTSSYDDEITKIANELNSSVGAGSPEESIDDFDFNEKLAYSLAMAEAYINLPYLKQLASFEKKAYAQGYTPEQIEEKLAQAGVGERYIPLSKVMDIQTRRGKAKK